VESVLTGAELETTVSLESVLASDAAARARAERYIADRF